MAYTQYSISGLWNGRKPAYVVLRNSAVVAAADTHGAACRAIVAAFEAEFGPVREFFRECAADFNADGSSTYTAADLMADPREVFQAIANHGFDLARRTAGSRYVADDSTRTLAADSI